MKEKVKYYEVEFDHDIRSREHGNETIGFYSICIRAMREPSYEEAEEAQKFMRSEAEKSGIPVKSVESEIILSMVGFFDGHHYTFDSDMEKV